MEINFVDVLIVLIIATLFVFSLIVVRRNKGKCISCSRSEGCPFRKVK